MTAADKTIKGFSKFTKQQKIDWVADTFHSDPASMKEVLAQCSCSDPVQQKILDAFSENTLSNFPLPYGIAPNFIINGVSYAIPMVIEESSVVAAASAAAKYWQDRGGFRAQVISTTKIGQIHLTCDQDQFSTFFYEHMDTIRRSCDHLLSNMEKRGGGLESTEVVSFAEEKGYYQIRMTFETCDSMGANFINSVLETFAKALLDIYQSIYGNEGDLQIIMCILSNYTPDSLVRSEVTCSVEELGVVDSLSPAVFAKKFEMAVRIAHIDLYRATTHNKGIFNGIDAVVLATGNDYRAVEACGHTFACRDGQYKSLSHCDITDGMFRFWIEVPMSLGTVGGLTRLHPLAKTSLDILGQPSASELMQITATVGLAQNFSAVRSLITTGIQKGHMKMHLSNLLYQLQATEKECQAAINYFEKKIISHQAVREFLDILRNDSFHTHLDLNNS